MASPPVPPVNVDTVYELVGRKPVLLGELIEQRVRNRSRGRPEEREHIKRCWEPDPAKKLGIYARAIRETQDAWPRSSWRCATPRPPSRKRTRHGRISDRRAANMHKLVRDLRVRCLRPGLSISEAADVLWATNSSELYVLLTVDREWPPHRFERWLADTWRRLLLP